MGKFGLGKKGDGDEDSSRKALFGSKSKSKSSAPPASNPYAQPAIPPDPYTQAKMRAGVAPLQPGPPGTGGMANSSGIPAPNHGGNNGPQPNGGDRKFGGPPRDQGMDNRYGPSKGANDGGGYAANQYGNPNGYGAGNSGGNPYAAHSQPGGNTRQGGYGGLGQANSYDTTSTDTNRDALFGGARDKALQQPPSSTGGPPGYEYNPTDQSQERSYGAYGDRQLTAEEEEEEDVLATKQEIKFMKQQDVSSSRNALRMAEQAEETGRNTLARLGAQGERIHNTDRNLDIGNSHINIAEDRAKELKTLNRSMFAVHVNNPFTAKSRLADQDEKIMNRHRLEREQREANRETAFKGTQRMNQNFKSLDETPRGTRGKTSLAERAKYQFEADDEDDQMEDEIDRNLDDLSGVAGRLHRLALATGEEVEQQNKQLTKIAEKSDRLDDRVHYQTERLKRIR